MKSTLYQHLISIIEIDCGEMVSHIGISIGTDMIFGGIGWIKLSIQLLESLEQWLVWGDQGLWIQIQSLQMVLSK